MFPERIRTFDQSYPVRVNVQPHKFDKNLIAVPQTPYELDCGVAYGKRKQVFDTLNNKWKPGKLVVRPFEVRSITNECTSDCWESYMYGQLVRRVSGPLAGYQASEATGWDTPVEPSSVLMRRALARAYAKIGEPTVDMAVNLAEAGQTLRMLTNPLGSLSKLLPKLWSPTFYKGRHGPRKLPLATTTAANRWLEYRYGLLPLMSDCNQIIDIFTKNLKSAKREYERSAAVEKTTGSRYWSSGPYQLAQFQAECIKSFQIDGVNLYRSTIYYSAWEEPGYYGATRLGLNPKYILNTAWELIPYSFVVDWVFNVGDFLRAVTTIGDPNVLAISGSIKRISKRTERFLDVHVYGRGRVESTSCFTSTAEAYTRNTEDTIPLTSVSSLLSIRNPLANIKHIADGLSLMWQSVAKKIH